MSPTFPHGVSRAIWAHSIGTRHPTLWCQTRQWGGRPRDNWLITSPPSVTQKNLYAFLGKHLTFLGKDTGIIFSTVSPFPKWPICPYKAVLQAKDTGNDLPRWGREKKSIGNGSLSFSYSSSTDISHKKNPKGKTKNKIPKILLTTQVVSLHTDSWDTKAWLTMPPTSFLYKYTRLHSFNLPHLSLPLSFSLSLSTPLLCSLQETKRIAFHSVPFLLLIKSNGISTHVVS